MKSSSSNGIKLTATMLNKEILNLMKSYCCFRGFGVVRSKKGIRNLTADVLVPENFSAESLDSVSREILFPMVRNLDNTARNLGVPTKVIPMNWEIPFGLVDGSTDHLEGMSTRLIISRDITLPQLPMAPRTLVLRLDIMVDIAGQ